MTLEEILWFLKDVTGSGKQYSAKCPAHDDRKASLSVSEGEDGRILLNCHAGCSAEEICGALGIKVSDLFSKRSEPPQKVQNSRSKVIAEYVYTDLNGKPVSKKLRYANKAFCWLKPDGNDKWTKGRNGQAPLYNQFSANSCEHLCVVEGEKDVETLRRFNIPAVSLPDGAKSKWLEEYTNFFFARRVYIIQDNDTPGKEFARFVARNINGSAQSIKIIDLSQIWDNMPEHADISDYVSEFPREWETKFNELVSNTAEWSAVEDEKAEQGIIQLSDVEATKTDWLWKPYIPKGKITLMTADPGTGKTYFCLYLCAQVSTGRPFYGEETPYKEPQKAVYQTAEDGIADTIKPRLIPMNPNFKNIFTIDESKKGLSFADEEDKRIENALKTYRPALMVFDPLQAYLGADVDMHRANEVRPVLSRLAILAEKYNCAILLIMHNSKMSSNKALYRGLGSIDIPAISRSMLMLGKNPDNPGEIVLCQEKSSLAAHGKSILFRICPEFGGIVFDGFSELTADEILSPKKQSRDKPSVTKDQATEELLQLIGERNYCELEEVQQLQEETGISERTMYRAKKDLGIDTVSIGYSINKHTYWITPEVDKAEFKKQMKEKLYNSDNVETETP